ncbi:hypothetical protein AVEN_170-1 [Araneus ventricosus]|uniref:RNase H type-1 domain-containing protein n=1 Tax=Araneus ventricosus TaxID=182803 RepID=A0A4Y2D200_ARAVE|nr:hypothetical protein AVEN_170-1 [Araneus ventricosus]
MLLHLKAQQEAIFINVTCLRKEIKFEGLSYQPRVHTVFQAELMGLKEAITRESQGNKITKIWTDSLSSVMAVLDPHTSHQLSRDIQSLLKQNRNMVRWIKAHTGYRGNEEADTFAENAITEGVVMKALNPRCELKQHLQELFFKKLQNIWDNGKLDALFIKCSKQLTCEEILFVTGHGPFSSFLNRFHLLDSDSCASRRSHPLCDISPIDSLLAYQETSYFTGKSVVPKSSGESKFKKKNNKHD